MKGKLLKGLLTVGGAIMFSTLGIFASDTLRGIDHDFSQIAGIGGSAGGVCPQGMFPFKNGETLLCVDMYEASTGEKCPHRNPVNALETEKNANTAECYPASIANASPWSFISLPQAQRVCAAAGKRLPTSGEWYRIALGTQSEACVINKNAPGMTGTSECISGSGAYDTVGNVWEWVDAAVEGVRFENRDLPPEGYVSSVDASGVAITSAPDPQHLYGSDYFWSKSDGVFGVIRGGFYGSGDDAGLYTVNASVATSFVSQGVGFRCVEDVL